MIQEVSTSILRDKHEQRERVSLTLMESAGHGECVSVLVDGGNINLVMQ